MQISKDDLKQIRYIKSEIETIENQIRDLRPLMVTDKVSGSSAYFPYTARSFTVEGLGTEEYSRKAYMLERKLRKKKNELADTLTKVNEFIDSIQDSLVRQIITLRYSEGLTWNEVADKIGSNNTSESVRKIAERYLKNCPTCPN